MERPAGSGEPEPHGEGYSRLHDRSKATIIDECRLIQLRSNSVRLIQASWRLVRLLRRAQRLGGMSSHYLPEVSMSEDNAQMAVSESHSDGAMIHVQSDSGANVVLARPDSPVVMRAVLRGSSGCLVTLASSAALSTNDSFRIKILFDGHASAYLDGGVSPDLRRDVIGSSCLWRQTQIAVLTHPFNIAVHAPSRRVAALTICNDLYFLPFVLRDGAIEFAMRQDLFPLSI